MPAALRFWPLTLLLCLLPLWCVGLFSRGLWTPDEPREAAIAGAMADGAGWAVPVLAGEPFCEKPPLTYWLSGAAIHVFGRDAGVARLPNLLWLAISVLSVGLLASAAMGGGRSGAIAGLVAGVAMGTSELTTQVLIWLATDAPLTAGVSLTLLGAYRGLHTTDWRGRLGWYLLMHGGLALGFLAKNIVAWVIPGLAFVAFIAWECRWRELLRWELWCGFVAQAALIGPWIWGVAQHPDAGHLLKVFFYDNLVGRFVPVDGVSYQEGHRNWPGKYLVELPAFLAPWTFLAVAAIRRGWRGCAADQPQRTAWRFAAAGVIPALLLLSVSNTARGIYLAPVLPGMMVALGCWAVSHGGQPDRFERVMLWLTAGLLMLVAVIGPLAGVGLAWWWPGAGLSVGVLVVDALLWAGGLVAVGKGVACMRRERWSMAGILLGSSVILAVVGGVRTGLEVVDQFQDPTAMTRGVAALAQQGPVALFQPDETTQAALDWQQRLRPPVYRDEKSMAAAFAATPDLKVLVKQPRQGPGAGEFLASLGMVEIVRFDIPGGRRHAVYGRR